MSLVFEVFEVFEAEESARFVCTLAIGLLTSVRNGAMSLGEAERLLFSPRTSKALREKGISLELSELIMDCCELEDVLNLVPSKFNSSLQNMSDKFMVFLENSTARVTDMNFLEIR